MTPTYADMETLRAAIAAGQCELALTMLDAIVTADEPDPPASFPQNRYMAGIVGESIATVKGWGLTSPEARAALDALLDDETVMIAGYRRSMCEKFRTKRAGKTAVPW